MTENPKVNSPEFAGGSEVRIKGPNGQQIKKIFTRSSCPRGADGFRNIGDHANRSAAIAGVSQKLGCGQDTLRSWVSQEETDMGQRPGLSTDDKVRLQALEKENRELRQANELLKKASAYFAQAELDRPYRK